MGIDGLDIGLYLNITFFSVLGIGLLFGLIKGFRRSLYSFIVTLVFLAVFFLTVNMVVEWFYSAEIGFLSNIYQTYLPIDGQPQNIQDVVHLLLQENAAEYFSASESSEEVILFIDSLGMFALKIVYTIIYFTAFQLIYRFILFIVGLFIFAKGRAKNKKGKRNRPLGAVFGTLTAALNLFVMIIVLSGIMSIAESLTTLQAFQDTEEVGFEINYNPRITSLDQSLEKVGRLKYNELAEDSQTQQLEEALDSLNEIIESYNSNIIIQVIDSYKVEDEATGEDKNMAILLFDEVLSINYDDQKIALREDLKVFVSVADVYLNSEFYDTNNITDLKSDEITGIFNNLSKSKLLVSIIPVGIELGTQSFEVEGLVLDEEFLDFIYNDVDWQSEIQQLGAVAATGIMILENANPTGDENIDYTTVPFSGDLTQTMFNELSESKLAEYGSFIAFEYLLENNDDIESIFITAPTDIDWQDEFKAFGTIANEILSTGLTVSDIENSEGQDLLMLFVDVDLTVLLDSQLTTTALINILSGNTNISMDIEFLHIPDLDYNEWLDTLDQDGNLVLAGELRRILTSLNILVQYLGEIDLDDIKPEDLGNITDEDIDEMFESQILVASITETIRTIETGGVSLIIPDSVLDSDGYILKEEVKNLFKSLTLIAGETACEPGDTACEEEGFDFTKAINLSSENIDKLFNSEILFATASNMLNEFDQLIVPKDVLITIQVEQADLVIVSKTEIKAAFLAIAAMGIDIGDEEMTFDETLLLNLSVDAETDPTTLDRTKTDKLFASKILHATISDFLIKETTPTPPEEATIIVPYYSTTNYADTDTNVVIIEDTVGEVTYISSYELIEVLEAILILEITDFTEFENFDIGLIINNSDELLDSAILHATISDQLKNSISGDALVVPEKDVDGVSIEITVGEVGKETTFITKDELLSVFNALELLEIEDFEGITLDTLDFNLIIDNVDDLLDSAIIHATISSQIIEQSDGESLVLPSLDLNNDEVITEVSGTEYIAKTEISNTLSALQVFGIEGFDDFETMTFDSSLILELSMDPINDPTTLDVTKSNTVLSSKIIHATLSKIIFDAGEPDAITGDSDIVVPYVAATNYLSTGSDAVRFVTNDLDEYIVEAELTELFRAVLALDIEDFTQVDTLILDDIIPHKNIIFNSAILQATISNQVIKLGDDGSLVVPTKDLDNELIMVSKGNALDNEDTDYIRKEELISILEALQVLGINDFNNVEVDASIIKELSIDPINDPTTLDETKANTVLSSKIVHATISKVLFDAAEPDEITNESVLKVPFVAPDNYLSTGNDQVRFMTEDLDEYIIEEELTELFKAVLALDIDDFNQVDTLFLSDIIPHKNIIFKSAILHATISSTIIDLGSDGNLTVPSLDLDNQDILITKGDVLLLEDTEYITEVELISTLDALAVLGIDDFNNVEVDASIIERMGTDADSTVLDDVKATTVLSSKIVHATISKVLFDAGEPDEITGESDLIIPYHASEVYAGTGNDNVRFTTDDSDVYIIEEELTELFRVVLALDIDDFNQVDTLFLSDIIPHKDFIFDSAILHTTISSTVIDLGDDGSLTVPSLDLANDEVLLSVGDALLSEDTDYVVKTELVSTLEALQVLGIDDFNQVEVDASIITELSVDPINDPTTLDETKANTVLSSKIVHATLSKVLFDAGEPDEITGESDLIIPYHASEVYAGTGNDNVRFTTDDSDVYIIEEELTELFRAVLALDIDDFNQVDTLFLDDIIPHKDFIFDSAILHATISDKIIDLGSDGSLTVPSLDLDNEEVLKSIGDALLLEDTDYVIKTELISTLEALQVLGINDFNQVEVDASIITELSVDPINDPTTLDESKSETVLSSKIVHATLSKVLFDAGEPDEITGESDLIIPYHASEVYVGTATDDVRFTTNDSDKYIIEEELTELFRAVLALDIDDFNQVDTLFLSDIIPHKDFIFDSAILHATISDKIIDLGSDGSLTVPSLDLANDEVLLSVGDALLSEETDYVVKTELVSTLEALQVLGINDFNQVEVDASIIKEMGTDADDTVLDETKSDTVLSSKIVHATLSKVLFDAGEPDEITGESDLVIPYIAADLYSDLTDEIRFTTTDSDKYIVELELTELFRAVLALDITDFNQVGSLLISDILPHKNIIFKSAILHATISDTIIELGNDGDLTVPSLDLNNDDVRTIKGDALLQEDTEYIVEIELINTLDALNVLGIDDFNNVVVNTAIIKQLSVDPISDPTTLDETKSATVLSSKIVHSTLSKIIFDSGTPDEITGDSDLIVPYIAAQLYSDSTDAVRFVTNDLDKYIVEIELNEVFRTVLTLDITDFNEFGTLLISEILPHKNIIFKSAIIHATISDTIIELGDDGSLTVPSLDLNNDDVTLIKGDALLQEDTEYVIESELINTLDALNVLGIDDFNNVVVNTAIIKKLSVDPVSDPTTLDETKSATVLSSKIVHATLSKIIFDAGTPDEITGDSDLIVPYIAAELYSDSTDEVRFITNDSDKYIVEIELNEVFRTVLVLDINDFNEVGSLLISEILPHKNVIFNSSIIHATISDTIIELGNDGDLTVPSLDLNNDDITLTKGDALLQEDTEYIIETELINTLDALNVLGIDDFSNVVINAGILQNLSVDPINDPTTLDQTKSDTVLSSKIVHASLSTMIIDSGEPDEITGNRDLTVPYIAAEDYSDLTNDVRFLTNDSDEYIVEIELTEFFEAVLALNIDDFNNVSSLGLTDIINNQDELLDSAILHATISKQVFDLEVNSTSIVVPNYNDAGVSITITDNTDINHIINYLEKTELTDFFAAINLLGGASTINDFQGAISLDKLFESQYPGTYEANQNTLLASSIMQATISLKIDDLETGGKVVVPSVDILENAIEVTHNTDYFIYKTEIKSLINVMDLVGFSSLESFDGQFKLSTFSTSTNQDILLTSVIMHRTLSQQLLDNTAIVVPRTTLEDNLTNNNVHVTTTLGSEDFIVGTEIKALINVMNLISDPNSNIDSVSSDIDFSKFDEDVYPGNQTILLSSGIMHASLSDELLSLNDNVLFVPKYNQDSETLNDQIRFDNVSGTDFIIKAEVKDIINAFLEMGYNDLSAFDSNPTLAPSKFFDNISLYLESASFHATISNKILAGNSPSLIIPSRNINDTFDIKIVQTELTYIEQNETIALVNALSELGISDFDSSISGSAMTGLTGPQLDIILISGTMHLSIDDIIRDNNSVNTKIPAKAVDDLFALTNILIKDEIKNFILAAKAFAGEGSDVSAFDFDTLDVTTLASMPEAQRNIILDSMIMRNILTPKVEQADGLDPFFTLIASDYEDADTNSFLTKDGINRYIAHLS